MTHTSRPRAYSYDNLKCLLIFCVVLAHLLEVNGAFAGKDDLYRLIYAFHMPAFLFLSGWFARFDRKKIVFQLLYTYLVMQLLYCLFDRCLLHPDDPFPFQFTTPYWVLWYLLVLVIFSLLLPLFRQEDRRKQGVILAGLVVLSLLSGLDENISYFMALARVANFAPYFFLGHYARQNQGAIAAFVRRRDRTALWLSLGLTALWGATVVFLLKTNWLTTDMLYASKAYTEVYGPAQRLAALVIALVWIAFLLLVVQRFLLARIPLVSMVGKNTLPIFILHGFVVKYLEKTSFLNVDGLGRPGMTLLLTLVLLVVLGSPWVARVTQFLLGGRWLQQLWEKLWRP